MLEPSIKELMEVIPSRFLLVNAAAQRARIISEEAEEQDIALREKAISIAINDIAGGRLKTHPITRED